MKEVLIAILSSSVVSSAITLIPLLLFFKQKKRQEQLIADKSATDLEFADINNFEKKFNLQQKILIDLQNRFLTLQADFYKIMQENYLLKLKIEKFKAKYNIKED